MIDLVGDLNEFLELLNKIQQFNSSKAAGERKIGYKYLKSRLYLFKVDSTKSSKVVVDNATVWNHLDFHTTFSWLV